MLRRACKFELQPGGHAREAADRHIVLHLCGHLLQQRRHRAVPTLLLLLQTDNPCKANLLSSAASSPTPHQHRFHDISRLCRSVATTAKSSPKPAAAPRKAMANGGRPDGMGMAPLLPVLLSTGKLLLTARCPVSSCVALGTPLLRLPDAGFCPVCCGVPAAAGRLVRCCRTPSSGCGASCDTCGEVTTVNHSDPGCENSGLGIRILGLSVIRVVGPVYWLYGFVSGWIDISYALFLEGCYSARCLTATCVPRDSETPTDLARCSIASCATRRSLSCPICPDAALLPSMAVCCRLTEDEGRGA